MLVLHLLPSGRTGASRKPGLLKVSRFLSDRGVRLGTRMSLQISFSSSTIGRFAGGTGVTLNH